MLEGSARVTFGFALWQQDEGVLQRLWRWTAPLRDYFNFNWKLGNFLFSISTLLIGALVLAAAFVVSRYLRAFIEGRMARHKYIDPGVQFTVLRLVHYVGVPLAFVLFFQGGVHAGFPSAVRGPSGKPTEGRVRSINLRTTVVMTNGNIAAIVPNSKLVNHNFLNWSY